MTGTDSCTETGVSGPRHRHLRREHKPPARGPGRGTLEETRNIAFHFWSPVYDPLESNRLLSEWRLPLRVGVGGDGVTEKWRGPPRDPPEGPP